MPDALADIDRMFAGTQPPPDDGGSLSAVFNHLQRCGASAVYLADQRGDLLAAYPPLHGPAHNAVYAAASQAGPGKARRGLIGSYLVRFHRKSQPFVIN